MNMQKFLFQDDVLQYRESVRTVLPWVPREKCSWPPRGCDAIREDMGASPPELQFGFHTWGTDLKPAAEGITEAEYEFLGEMDRNGGFV